MTDADASRPRSRPNGWDHFLHYPVSYADPARLSVCLDDEIRPEVCTRLLSTRRLANRLSARLVKSYDLNDCEPPQADLDAEIALADVEALTAIARRAGAIYWSNSLSGLVLAKEVTAVSEALGDEVWMLALRNRALGGPARPIGDIDEAMTELTNDGWRCLSAWCCAQDDAIGRRVRLKLPPNPDLDVVPEGKIAEVGPEITRRAADKADKADKGDAA